MAKGRPPDPMRARRHTGHRPLPAQWAPVGAPDVLTQVPPPPQSLPAGARPFWEAACAELLPRGLHSSDLMLVEMLATAIYRHRQAGEYVAQAGLLEGEDGLRANPALKVEKDSAATYLRLAETLGLTPAARMRLGVMQVSGQSALLTLVQRIEAQAAAALARDGAPKRPARERKRPTKREA